jgi:release factor glutamine methyltransferase
VGELVRRTAAYLAERGSPSARLDAELLLAHSLGVDRLAIYTEHDRPLLAGEVDAFRELVRRRGRREPVAYILGRRAFRGLELAVEPGVLVPRPETELLVEWAVEVAPQGGSLLDWGAGSGAVALAVAHERPDLEVTAVERSDAALAVARANAEAAGLAVALLLSDGFAAVAGRRFSVVAANPPYLSEDDLAGAPPELLFEPRGALVAGPTGLEALERLAREAPAHLDPGGWLLSEVGLGQAEAVEALWRGAGLDPVTSRRDLSGVDRVVGGRAPIAPPPGGSR